MNTNKINMSYLAICLLKNKCMCDVSNYTVKEFFSLMVFGNYVNVMISFFKHLFNISNQVISRFSYTIYIKYKILYENV